MSSEKCRPSCLGLNVLNPSQWRTRTQQTYTINIATDVQAEGRASIALILIQFAQDVPISVPEDSTYYRFDQNTNLQIWNSFDYDFLGFSLEMIS